jgi:hypothetical protein
MKLKTILATTMAGLMLAGSRLRRQRRQESGYHRHCPEL